MTRLTGKVSTFTQMVPLTMVNGKWINSMVRESRLGPMVRDMKVSILMAKSMGKELFTLLMDQSIKEHSNRTKFKVQESTSGPMARPMKANGRIIKCMVKVFWYGEMASGMKEVSQMTCVTVSVDSNGVMEGSMRVHGRKGNSMELENSLIERDKFAQVNGKMERKPNGFLENCGF
jgi:hypothetical protein